ncbi:MAG: helix-turn-helix transcriptional regulator [Clostridia bacterium]|nr:helix-turn-helix transcriptional regulator [Clostridia bacterium]
MYEKLRQIREEKGYTIEDMAVVINKSPCNYFKKENGDVKFSVNEAIQISKFLKRKVETIFFKNELSESEKEVK